MAKGEGKVVAQNKKSASRLYYRRYARSRNGSNWYRDQECSSSSYQLKDGFAQVKNGEVWLSNVHIAPYEEGNIWNQEPERRRKLLLHKNKSRN